MARAPESVRTQSQFYMLRVLSKQSIVDLQNLDNLFCKIVGVPKGSYRVEYQYLPMDLTSPTRRRIGLRGTINLGDIAHDGPFYVLLRLDDQELTDSFMSTLTTHMNTHVSGLVCQLCAELGVPKVEFSVEVTNRRRHLGTADDVELLHERLVKLEVDLIGFYPDLRGDDKEDWTLRVVGFVSMLKKLMLKSSVRDLKDVTEALILESLIREPTESDSRALRPILRGLAETPVVERTGVPRKVARNSDGREEDVVRVEGQQAAATQVVNMPEEGDSLQKDEIMRRVVAGRHSDTLSLSQVQRLRQDLNLLAEEPIDTYNADQLLAMEDIHGEYQMEWLNLQSTVSSSVSDAVNAEIGRLRQMMNFRSGQIIAEDSEDSYDDFPPGIVNPASHDSYASMLETSQLNLELSRQILRNSDGSRIGHRTDTSVTSQVMTTVAVGSVDGSRNVQQTVPLQSQSLLDQSMRSIGHGVFMQRPSSLPPPMTPMRGISPITSGGPVGTSTPSRENILSSRENILNESFQNLDLIDRVRTNNWVRSQPSTLLQPNIVVSNPMENILLSSESSTRLQHGTTTTGVFRDIMDVSRLDFRGSMAGPVVSTTAPTCLGAISRNRNAEAPILSTTINPTSFPAGVHFSLPGYNPVGYSTPSLGLSNASVPQPSGSGRVTTTQSVTSAVSSTFVSELDPLSNFGLLGGANVPNTTCYPSTTLGGNPYMARSSSTRASAFSSVPTAFSSATRTFSSVAGGFSNPAGAFSSASGIYGGTGGMRGGMSGGGVTNLVLLQPWEDKVHLYPQLVTYLGIVQRYMEKTFFTWATLDPVTNAWVLGEWTFTLEQLLEFYDENKEVTKCMTTCQDLRKDLGNWIQDERTLAKHDVSRIQQSIRKVDFVQNCFITWSDALNEKYRHYGLHHKKDTSGTVPEVKISKFTGYDGAVNVYEFLDTFNHAYVNKVHNPVDRALLLYTNFLDETLQTEFKELQRDYNKLVRGLIVYYGEGERIVEQQMKQIEKITLKTQSVEHTVQYLREILVRFRILRNMYKKTSADAALSAIDISNFEIISKPAIRKLYDKQTICSFVGTIVKQLKHRSGEIRRAWFKILTEEQKKLRERTMGIVDNTLPATDTSEEDGRALYDLFIGLIETEIDNQTITGDYNKVNPKPKKDADQASGKKSGNKPPGPKSITMAKRQTKRLMSGKLNAFQEVGLLKKILFRYHNLAYKQAKEMFDVKNDGYDTQLNGILENGKAGRDYDQKFFNRCPVCPRDQPGHEMAFCVMSLRAGCEGRKRCASVRKVCFYCLHQSCYADKVRKILEKRRSSDTDRNNPDWYRGILDSCKFPGSQVPCPGCTSDSRITTSVHILICTLHQCKKEETEAEMRKKVKSFSGKDLIMVMRRPFPDHVASSLRVDGIKVDELEQKQVHKSKTVTWSDEPVFQTWSGNVLDRAKIEESSIIRESDEYSVYFTQDLMIGRQSCLSFHDSGANGALMKKEVADECGAKCIDSRPQQIVGAGNHLTCTGYGRYRLILGQCDDWHYYEIICNAIQDITGLLPLVDMKAINEEVRSYDQQHSNLLTNEALPDSAGGRTVGLLIGINTPEFCPEVLFTCPGGLIVGKARLRDKYGSRIVYAGTHHLFTKAYTYAASQMGVDVVPGSAAIFNVQNLFFSEMANAFRNSMLCDVVQFNGETVRKIMSTVPSSDVSIESDADSIDEPFVCVRSEENQFLAVPENLDKEDDILEDFRIDLLRSEGLFEPFVDSACTDVITGKDVKQCECSNTCNNTADWKVHRVKRLKELIREWDDAEETGTVIDFRCPSCQDCPKCLSEGKTRARSCREEDEQHIVDLSIRIEYPDKLGDFGRTYVKLPFVKQPDTLNARWKANSNIAQAMAILHQQLRLDRGSKDELVAFMTDITERDFCTQVDFLPVELQNHIWGSPTIHFFPWRGVWKSSSISTPCRMVVDPLVSGLNAILAKGQNSLNNLQQLLLRFRGVPIVATFDIAKMYNNLFLEVDNYQYQLFLWKENLDPDAELKYMVFLRAMYGVVCTGNQAETSIRRAAKHYQDIYPLGAAAIMNEVYVDDGLPTANTRELMLVVRYQVEEILKACGFLLKVWTTCGDAELDAKASSDGISLSVCGMRWFPKDDLMSLAWGEMNFRTNYRGKRKPNPVPVLTGKDVANILPDVIRRVDAVSQVAQVYDIVGSLEPLKARFKLDLAKLVDRGLDWKDPLPEELIPSWVKNFEIIQDLRSVQFSRCVIPVDAKKPEFVLIECHDAAQLMAFMGIWAVCEKRDGSYSCQLLFSRSSLQRGTIPRNELTSSLLGAQGVFIVKSALKNYVSDVIRVGDSSVAMAWEANRDARLKIWTYSRVRQIHRLTKGIPCFHVPSQLNPADIGTRGAATLDDLKSAGPWFSGLPWMKQPLSDMMFSKGGPLRTYAEVCSTLSDEEKTEIAKEEQPELVEIGLVSRSIALRTDYNDLFVSPDLEQHRIHDCADSEERSAKWDHFSRFFWCHEPTTVSALVGCVSATTRSNPVVVCQTMAEPCCDGMLIDVVKFGWEKSNRVIAFVYKFFFEAYHRAHVEKDCAAYGPDARDLARKMKIKCKKCRDFVPPGVNLSYLDRLHRKSEETPDFDLLAHRNTPVEYTNRVNRVVKKKVTSPELSKEIREDVNKAVQRQKEIDERQAQIRDEQAQKRQDERPNEYTRQGKHFTVLLYDRELAAAMFYFVQIASQDFSKRASSKAKEKATLREHVWFCNKRLLRRDNLEKRDIELAFFDLPTVNYLSPKLLKDHPICYSYLVHLHWNILAHRGVRSQERACEQVFSISGVRGLLQTLKKDCRRCRMLMGKTISQEMAGLSDHQLIIAPPFYSCIVDAMSPLEAFSMHNQRAVLSVYGLVFSCVSTGAVASYVLEREDTESVVKAFLRHFSRHGFSAYIFYDLSSAFSQSVNIEIQCRNLELVLNRLGVVAKSKATGAHEEHGKVERAVKGFKEIFSQKNVYGKKQSLISWETTLAVVANEINNLPVARLSGTTQSTREVDILTRNRLLLGRNNERSPSGDFFVPGKPGEQLDKIRQINADFYKKLMENIDQFIWKPKWFVQDRDVEIGDLVLFMIEEKKIASTWMLGVVDKKISEDLKPGKWSVRYRNASEGHYRYTDRSSRDLIVIHRTDEMDYNSHEHFKQLKTNHYFRRERESKTEELMAGD